MRRLPFAFSCLVLLLAAAHSAAGQEFRVGGYRAETLLGEAGLVPGRDYVSFAGDTGFVEWRPSEEKLARLVSAENGLLSNFQLNVVNLERPFVGFSGHASDREIDASMLALLTGVGHRLVSLGNNHILDFGDKGVSFTRSAIERAGLQVIGLRERPVHFWQGGGRRIAIYSLTAGTDEEDPRNLALRLGDADLDLVNRLSAGADFRIAFLHLGSMSSYPSVHERAEVARAIDRGADLVVCSGTHFVKGFAREKARPVVYGLGDHLLSSVNPGTEPVGMFVVAGFDASGLRQLFAVPFRNRVAADDTGALDEAEFRRFQALFRQRSTTDTGRYYSDPRTLSVLKHRIARFRPSDLKTIRPRQLVYAARILGQNYPFAAGGGAAIGCLLVVLLLRRRSRRNRTRLNQGTAA